MSNGRITFYRASTYQDAVRSYKIVVGGKTVGTLEPKGSLSVPVGAGTHSCRARISWTGSSPVEVTVPEGGEVRVLVKPTEGGGMLSRLWGREGWLILCPDED